MPKRLSLLAAALIAIAACVDDSRSAPETAVLGVSLEATRQLAGAHFRGLWVSKRQTTVGTPKSDDGDAYFDNIFALCQKEGVNFIRISMYWEAYVASPAEFVNELHTIAQHADAAGVKVLWCNSQWMVSTAMPAGSGTGIGFPMEYMGRYRDFVGTDAERVKAFWRDFWDRSVTHDVTGTDMWSDMADFLDVVAAAVDGYSSTWGYEFINEPWVGTSPDSSVNRSNIPKMGAFSAFITERLRTRTAKPLAFNIMFQGGTFSADWRQVIPGFDPITKTVDADKSRNFVVSYHIYDNAPALQGTTLDKIRSIALAVPGPSNGWWVLSEYNVDAGSTLTEQIAIDFGAISRQYGAVAIAMESIRPTAYTKDWTRDLQRYDFTTGKRALTAAGLHWMKSLDAYRDGAP